ncbi:MAG: threonylcarbamoyl-AMP synthase [Planctomycetaceae bacterium]|nr:threonylcarbamoyl-AMP synthase [Planctomycetaceae bacterium]
MPTRCLTIDPQLPDPSVIAEAAAILRRGGIVAFPTETVYGLGANALDGAAVRRIFAAKGRPANNPVIVHVTSSDAARQLAAEWPAPAERLAAQFWPGPLTMVVKKQPHVPDEVTAGGATVAIRCPQHPIARALIDAAGVPLAAPSANASNRISATTAKHVLRTLDGRIDLVLDGGPAGGGLESTVVDVSVNPPRVLRPGLISADALSAALDMTVRTAEHAVVERGAAPSPGMLARHYAPLIPLEICPRGVERAQELSASGQRVALVTHLPVAHSLPSVQVAILSNDPAGYASRLYQTLYELESSGIERIVVVTPPQSAEWAAIHDRLRRASA